MFDITTFIQQDSLDIFIFLPIVILLGALHGLEPGRSKTMVAAFAIATRGTVKQQVILGISTAVAHAILITIATFAGLYFIDERLSYDSIWPYMQMTFGAIMFVMALWMMRRSWNQYQDLEKETIYHSLHPYAHVIDTGHGLLELKIYNRGEPPRFRLHSISHDGYYSLKDIKLELKRPDGSIEKFTFQKQSGFLESAEYISGKFEFMARLRLFHGDEANNYDVEFVSGDHKHMDSGLDILDLISPTYHSAQELAHINDIRKRFTAKKITRARIIMLGLKAGFPPSPAALAVLLLCLELKQIIPAIILISFFTMALATIIATSGMAATDKRISKYLISFSKISDMASYVSSVIILTIGCYITYHGLLTIK